ncbi:histidine phosphatase family protein [Candidatus Woesearchaeota archaeon]|nr:histidine phosphatase family protein [Candidatus Woesearchaeota archaeon]
MKLFIVQHAETTANAQGLSQGHLDYPLTPKGVEQARKIALRLKDEKIDVAYSSDSERALCTCKEVLCYHPKTELIITKLLREQCKGVFEGKHHEEISKAIEAAGVPYHLFNPEKGEALLEVWNKMISFFKSLQQKHDEQHVLLVSHGGPIACLLCHLHGKEIDERRDFVPRGNTALSIIQFNDSKQPEFIVVNCVKHLG